MANQFLASQVYANTMLLLFKNQLVYGKLVDGQYKDQVSDDNGLTVSVKRPPRFVDKKDGTAALAVQDIVTGSAPVKVDQYSKVHIAIGDIEYVTDYNALMRKTSMLSAASTLAHSVDMFISRKTLAFSSWVAGGKAGGAGGTNAITGNASIASPAEAMGAHTRLMAQGTPNDGNISGVVTFNDGELIRGSLMSDFTPSINVSMLERVRIPIISEVNWYATQQNPLLTTGTRVQGDGATVGSQVNAAGQNVNYRDVKGSTVLGAQMTSTLTVTDAALGTKTIKAGEVFTIQGVYAWDWKAQQQLDYLQQFTVISDAVAVAGVTSLTISPAIIVQGTNDGTSTDTNTVFGTAAQVPALNAYLTFVGAPSVPMQIRSAFHKRAISMVSTRLQMPFSGIASQAVDPDTGISIRYWRGSDITTGVHVHRWDCMYGAAVLDPMLGTRIGGFGG